MKCYKCGGEVIETEDGQHRVCKECGESADEKYICEFGYLHDYSKLELPEEDEYSKTFDNIEDLMKSLNDDEDEMSVDGIDGFSSSELQQARLELYAKLAEAEAEIAASAKGEDFSVVAERMREKLIQKLNNDLQDSTRKVAK